MNNLKEVFQWKVEKELKILLNNLKEVFQWKVEKEFKDRKIVGIIKITSISGIWAMILIIIFFMKWHMLYRALWAYSIYMAPKGQASMHNPQSSQPSRTFMVYPIFIIRSLGHFGTHCSQTPQYSLSIIYNLSPYFNIKNLLL